METGWQVTGDRIVCLLPWDYLSVVRHLFRHTCPGIMPAATVSGWDRSPAVCPLRIGYPGMPGRSIQRQTREHDPGGQVSSPSPSCNRPVPVPWRSATIWRFRILNGEFLISGKSADLW